MKKIIMKVLAFWAKMIIRKYQPKVIGITGSVGKTSTKEVVASILAHKFRVRASIKNYNNEFGLPLSIIGLESPGKNLWGWLKVFFKIKKLLLFKDRDYPEVLVLEMGVDREGDMDYLLKIVKPDIGVLTNVSQSHLEYFGSLEKIKKEKAKLLKNLNKDGLAILNSDNKYLKDLPKEIKSKCWLYGLEEGSDFVAKDISFVLPEDLLSGDFFGINFKLEYQGSVLPVILPGAISYPAIYSSLVALAIGFHLGLNLIEITKYLQEISSVSGRMEVLPGIKGTVIIDDSYNSSPESALSALKTIEKIKNINGRKIIIFGDMLELGSYSEEGHRLVGKKVAEIGVDLLVLIGEKSLDIFKSVLSNGFKEENVFKFDNVEEALVFVKEKITSKDLVLVKASRGMKLDKIVKELKLYKDGKSD
ncbi:MAG: Mur ligase family protein [Patescibacteria group bacterium]|nr:Mur ligase family protein [Patescibacteria group bacterium]